MKPGMICCLALVAVFGGGCSFVGQSGKRVVTDVNANKLLGTIGEEQLGANLVMVVPWGQYLPLDKDATPSETITIVRNDDTQKYGQSYQFRKNDGEVARIQLGVFSDPHAALMVFKAHLKIAAVGPDKDLTAQFGTRAGAWSVMRKGENLWRILLVRDNAVVSVDVPPPVRAEYDSTKVVTAIAKAIDSALVNGTLGVQRGKTLKVPRIVGLEPAGAVPPRTTIPGQVRISVPQNPQDKDSSYTEIVRSHPFHTPGVAPRARPAGQEKVTYQVTYITPGCVVASKRIAIDVLPPPP